MELDKNIKQQLAELLAEPNRACLQNTAMLNELLQKYPYYQPLHLLLAKANLHAEEVDTLAKTSLYTNGQLLHQFLFKTAYLPGNFTVVAGQTAAAEEIRLTDEQETFEEIAEVDINNYRPFRNSAHPETQTIPAPEHEGLLRKNSLEDDFVFESIASSDFFAFEQRFSNEVTTAEPEMPEIKVPVIEEHNEEAAAEFVRNQVSNYHDDKLPYTFLWWLDKTRKEHQSIFQPYALPKKESSNELQQQYVEHIFHIQSHLDETEVLLDTPEQAKPATKDFAIIESFIKNDPQITPPNAEQIDNENKAKKSAEDQNDLVSETLANIYIEQMLYDKAIDTYEKLSLKFPEKSRYFADLIQSIEKKI